MATFVREDNENLTTLLTLNIARKDYEAAINKELADIRKKSAIKGFRKGKAPMSYLKKVYGNEILANQINKLVNDELSAYLETNKVKVLGQPLLVQESFPRLNINKLEDYSFQFEIGLSPEIDLKGLDGSLTALEYKVTIEDDIVDQEILNWRKRVGNQEEGDEVSSDKDIVDLNVVELEGGEPKEGGVSTSVKVAIDMVSNPDLKEKLLTRKKGDKLELSIWDIEDQTQEFIKKNILGVATDADVNDIFSGTVEGVTLVVPGVPSKLAFKNSFGANIYNEVFGEDPAPEVKEGDEDDAITDIVPEPSEEEQKEVLEAVRKQVVGQLEDAFKNRAKGGYYLEIQKRMIENNPFDLPDEFLRKWLADANAEGGEKKVYSDEDYAKFAENLRWSILESALGKEFDIQVTLQEVESGVRESVKGYYGGYAPQAQIDSLTKMIMENKEQMEQRYRQMFSQKLFAELEKKVLPEQEEISSKKFRELFDKQ